MKMNGSNKNADEGARPKKRGTRISQNDVPANTLANAIRIPTAIAENYADDPVSPLQLAMALNMTPTSGPFKTLTGSSIAYGLTEGGYNAKEIKITSLGKRIVKPLEEGDDAAARIEALLKPRVIHEFLTKYNGKQLPREDIAQNVLEDMEVPSDRTSDVLSLIIESAEALNLLKDIKGKKFIDISGTSISSASEDNSVETEMVITPDIQETSASDLDSDSIAVQSTKVGQIQFTEKSFTNKKVFITHGKNQALISIIEEFLKLGELEAVVSVTKESVSKPVPEKFMEDMRACGAAIIHVDAERKLHDENGVEHVVLNPNVLIEIGAAMALYGKRFILLVQEGVELPSNLQGLYEVRYTGDDLGSAETIKLLNAINAMKNEPSPR